MYLGSRHRELFAGRDRTVNALEVRVLTSNISSIRNLCFYRLRALVLLAGAAMVAGVTFSSEENPSRFVQDTELVRS